MNLPFESTTEILDRHVSGFRQYRFGESVRLTFISQNFCDMIGYPKEELEGCSSVLLADLVFPADRHLYEGLLEHIRQSRAADSAEYRMVRKDGTLIFVRDTVSVRVGEDNSLTAYSTLTDITAIKAENENLQFINDTVPCGMLKFACDRKNPEITFVNKQLLDILRFPEARAGEINYLELCKSNIFLTIPMEERSRFANFLNRVYDAGSPIAGEISVLRCDGTKARLYGWVNKVTGEDGHEEFQCICMDITERYHTKRAGDTERYLKALSDVYEKIFEYDLANGTVKYVSGGSDTFSRIRNLPMHMEEATAQWVEHTVCAEDRPLVRNFFNSVFTQKPSADTRPPRILYRVEKGGKFLTYSGILLRIDAHVALFCCRRAQDEQEAEALRNENRSLKNLNENMQEIFMRYSDGVAAFEVTDDRVTPLYASDNVCEFFGYTKNEWLPLMKQSTSLKDFVAGSAVDYEKFSELLQTGEAEFTYYDIHADTEKRIKAICSHKQADSSSPRYVLLYKMGPTPSPEPPSSQTPQVSIRTFGYFDIFVNGKPIAFRNKKAKELLALLVDRRGGYVTSEQAIGYLWENEPASTVTLARYRKEALRLKNTLEEYGIGHIIESVDGKRRIIPEQVDCDLYGYLSGKEEYANAFKGSYLTDYSWGEMTLGELMSRTAD